jgi:flagellar hook assembly protein FlgD
MFTGYSGQKIKIKVYNKTGVLIRNLYEEQAVTSGRLEVEWDGKNDKGENVVSGMYIMLIDGGSYKAKEKVAVIH